SKLILKSTSGAHGGRPVVAGYIACNAFSSGTQSKVWSSRSKKSFVGVAVIRPSKSPSWGLVVVCISLGRLIQKLSFRTFAEIPWYEVPVVKLLLLLVLTTNSADTYPSGFWI